MKTITLKIFVSVMFLASVIACSSDSVSEENIDLTAPERLNRTSVWDGEIGTITEEGGLELTANKEALITAFEDILIKQGNSARIENLEIVTKTATNDPFDKAYMVIGSNNSDTSIGVVLVRSGGGASLVLDERFEKPKSVTCRGCATGCNLEYLNTTDGKRVPYCNVNGCISDCTKLETEVK